MLKVNVDPEYIGQFSSLVMIEEETDTTPLYVFVLL